MTAGLLDGTSVVQTSCPAPLDRDLALELLMADIGGGYQTAYWSNTSEHLDDYLPNRSFVWEGSEFTLADDVILGVVRDVRAGAAYVVPHRDAAAGVATSFETQEDVEWRVVEFEVQIARSAAGAPAKVANVGLSIAPDTTLDVVRSALMDRRVLIPVQDIGLFSHDRDVLTVALGGAMLGVVDDTDVISMPALGEAEREMLRDLNTVSEVMEAAAAPPAVIELDS